MPVQETQATWVLPGSGRSSGGGHCNPLQYSCLGNPMDRRAWRATVNGVTQSWTRLSTHRHILFEFSSVSQACPTLCDPMGCSMPGFPVHHQLLELAQIHVHLCGNAIQPPTQWTSHNITRSKLPFRFSKKNLYSCENLEVKTEIICLSRQ